MKMHQVCYTVCTFPNLHCLVKAVWRDCCLRLINDAFVTGALGVSTVFWVFKPVLKIQIQRKTNYTTSEADVKGVWRTSVCTGGVSLQSFVQVCQAFPFLTSV